jgi:hypothetical protein
LFQKILDYERRFGRTIQRGGDVEHLASKGRSFLPDDLELIRLALSEEIPPEYIVVAEGEEWVLPAGAYRRSGGPL